MMERFSVTSRPPCCKVDCRLKRLSSKITENIGLGHDEEMWSHANSPGAGRGLAFDDLVPAMRP